MLGYHLDTACRCHELLGSEATAVSDLRVRAGVALAVAGDAAWAEVGGKRFAARSFARVVAIRPPASPGRAAGRRLRRTVGDGRVERTAELVGQGLQEGCRDGDESAGFGWSSHARSGGCGVGRRLRSSREADRLKTPLRAHAAPARPPGSRAEVAPPIIVEFARRSVHGSTARPRPLAPTASELTLPP